MTYLHRVTDALTGGAMHIELGMWLNIPATTDPKAEASIARLATIPHTIPFKIGEQPPAAGTANSFEQYDLTIL